MNAATQDRTFLFGWPRFAGTVVHAVIDQYLDPDAPENRIDLVIGGERIQATSGDPHFTLRHNGALCGVTGGTGELMRVTPGVTFSPDGYAGKPSATVCRKCVRIWSTKYAPEMDAWTKTCRSCTRDLAITRFRSDGRTKDGVAAVCEECLDAASAAQAQAERVLRDAARAHEITEQRRRRAAKLVEQLTAWQRAPWAATFTCADQHVLDAQAHERQRAYEWVAMSAMEGVPDRVEHRTETLVDVRWVCPCGTADVPEQVKHLVAAVSGIDHGSLWVTDLGPVPVVGHPVD